jgi:hypothetical protein
MAFKLGKQQVAERNRLADELRQQGKTLNAAIVAYNAAVGPLSKALDEAVEEYNDILERARTLTGTVVDAAQQEFDGKSQRWQEGDKGNRVRSWMALVHFEGLELEGMVGCPPIFFFGPPDAAQTQRRPPSPHPEDVVQGAELAGV